MLGPETPISILIAQVEQEIAFVAARLTDRRAFLAILKSYTTGDGGMAPITEPPSMRIEGGNEKRGGRLNIGLAAVEILREAGRPLHGQTELLPKLHALGYTTKAAGLPTLLMRTGLIERTSPGTFGLKPTPVEN